MTLLASGLLLAILKQLIKPIEFASMALRSYKRETSARPAISFHDEAGF
jgi:hypothetical protein